MEREERGEGYDGRECHLKEAIDLHRIGHGVREHDPYLEHGVVVFEAHSVLLCAALKECLHDLAVARVVIL